MMTVKEVAEALRISEQTVRRRYKLYHIGRLVRVLRSDVFGDKSKNFLSIIQHDAGLTAATKAYWAACGLLELIDDDEDAVACPTEAGLLASTMAALAVEHPDYPVMGVDAVFPPTLAYVREHLPQGGGAKGEALRARLLRAA